MNPLPRQDPVPAPRHARLTPIIFGVLTLGVAARTAHFFANRSLWLDEAMLALNIGERSFLGLLDQLAFSQAAPLGFLWLEKLAVTVFGVGEMALRFFPLIAAIISLFLFAVLARRLLKPYAALLAIVLLALSTSQVYFAAEVKQYSFDVLWAVLILLLAHHASGVGADRGGSVGSRATWRRDALLVLGVAGAIGVWFSHPLIFTLPAALAYVVLERRRAGGHQAEATARGPLLVAMAWTGSFAISYFLTATAVPEGLMRSFWLSGFMPFPPTSAEEWAWFGQAFGDLIRYTHEAGWGRSAQSIGATHAVADVLVGIFLLAGVVYLARVRRALLLLLGAPAVLTLIASALSIYPFRGRLIQFLLPSTILFIAFGIEGAWSLGAERTTGWLAAIRRTSAAMAAAMCVLSAIVLWGWLGAPYREESRPVLRYVAGHSRPDDVLYVHSGARHAFEFYNQYCQECRPRATTIHRAPLYGLEVDGDVQLRQDLDGLSGHSRVWVVFGHEWWTWGAEEKRRILLWLRSAGRELDRLVATGASAYLFDLE